MIFVSGATGKLGRLIVQKLLTRVPTSQIGASVRDLTKASDLIAHGVSVRQADFDDPASLRDAWRGATTLLLVSSNAAARGGDPLAQHQRAIEAAKTVGIQRIVYTSQFSANPHSAFPPGRDHAATEAMLAAAGLRWTALRNGFYAASALDLLRPALASGVLEVVEDGKVAWTTHDDLAEAATVVLTTDTADGPTAPLTGTEALDFATLCQLASAVSGKPLRCDVISAEAFRRKMTSFGLPQGVIDIARGLYAAAGAGEFAATDDTLATLLGRPPQTMRAVLTEAFARS